MKPEAHDQAVAAAQRLVALGRRWVVDLDLEKFFDRVCHDRLLARLASWFVGQRYGPRRATTPSLLNFALPPSWFATQGLDSLSAGR